VNPFSVRLPGLNEPGLQDHKNHALNTGSIFFFFFFIVTRFHCLFFFSNFILFLNFT